MAENIDIESLRQALDQFVRAVNEGTSAIKDNKTAIDESKSSMDKAKEEIEKFRTAQYNATQKVTKELENLGRGAINSGGSFTVLNQGLDLVTKGLSTLVSKMPVIGGALKALGETAGEVAKLMVDQFQQAWNSYKELQDTGVVTSFENMRDVGRQTGLLYQDINKALGKHSTNLANFGGSVLSGMDAFGKVAQELTDTRKQFNALGISASEFSDFQAKYMTQEQFFNRARGKDVQQLARGTQEYIEQLDTISKLTGKSRRELQAQRDAALSEARFSSAIADSSKEVQESFLNLNSFMTEKAGPGLAQGLRDLASGAVTTDAAKSLVLATGGAAQGVVERLKRGEISASEAFEHLRKTMDPKKVQQIARYVGDSTLYTKNVVEMQKMQANSMKPEDIKRIEEERKKNLTGQNKLTSGLSDTEQQLYNTSRNLQDLATSSEILVNVMDSFSSGMDYLTEQMAKMAGKTLPDDVKARIEERKASSEARKAQQEFNKAIDESTKKIDEQVDKLDEQIKVSTGTRREELVLKRQELLNKRAVLQESKDRPAALREANVTGVTAAQMARQTLEEAQKKEAAAKQRREQVSPQEGKGKPAIDPSTGKPVKPGEPRVTGELGSLSAQFESGKQGSSAIGFDSTGGTSFGKYQIATRTGTMDKFMEHLKKTNPEIFERLSKAGPADSGVTGKFAQEWKKLAEEGKIQQSERDFIKATHYDVGVKGTGQNIQKMIEQSKALQEVMFSTSVQHGGAGASDIFNKMFKDGMNEKDFINAIYEERTKKFGSSTPKVQKSVMDRLTKEKVLAQGLIGRPPQQQAAESVQSQPQQQATAPAQPQQQAAAPAQPAINQAGVDRAHANMNKIAERLQAQARGETPEARPQQAAAPAQPTTTVRPQQQAAAPAQPAINQAGVDRAHANMNKIAERLQAQARGETPEARTGGIFRGPSTGYNVRLHDEEVVVPAQSAQVIKEPLNTSILGDGGSERLDKMLAAFETLISKQDIVIELLDNNNSQNRRMVRAIA